MLTFPLPAAINGDQLLAEINAAGVPALSVSVNGQGALCVDAPDAARDLIAAYITVHKADPMWGWSANERSRTNLASKPISTWSQADRDEALRLSLLPR